METLMERFQPGFSKELSVSNSKNDLICTFSRFRLIKIPIKGTKSIDCPIKKSATSKEPSIKISMEHSNALVLDEDGF